MQCVSSKSNCIFFPDRAMKSISLEF
uniref:Uncharacterized protein n=1 Tax=Anguilla anguilla TaxID=7936 RepID=A0A0E9XVB4_ANGAN